MLTVLALILERTAHHLIDIGVAHQIRQVPGQPVVPQRCSDEDTGGHLTRVVYLAIVDSDCLHELEQ